MKRYLLFLISIALSLSYSLANETTSREITKTSDGYIISYNIGRMEIKDNSFAPEFKICSADGFNTNISGGEPAYLLRHDTFIIPDGFSATVESINEEYKEYDGKLQEASSFYKINENESPIEIVSYDGFFPASTSDITSFNFYRGIKLAKIEVCPLQYDLKNNKIRAYSKLSYKLTFIPEPNGSKLSFKPGISHDDSFLKNNTLNFNDFIPPKKIKKAADFEEGEDWSEYLIITSEDLIPAAQKLADWKFVLGIRSKIVARQNWTSSEVKQYIENYYQDNPYLYYLMIIGDERKVPSNTVNIEGIEMLSDLPYAQISDNLLPDFHRGRFPAKNLTEALAMIEKSIEYEKNPPTESDFYSNADIIATFHDSYILASPLIPGQDGKEDARFVKTCEEIRTNLIANRISTNRIYSKFPYDCTPKYWNPNACMNSKITKLPDDLLTSDWSATDTDIFNAAQTGHYLMIFNGHATPDSWASIDFNTSHINRLSNGKRTPFIISTGCHTGSFKNDVSSIAYSFMKNRHSGAITVIAPSAQTLTDLNDVAIIGMINAIYTTPYINQYFRYSIPQYTTPIPTYRFGQILDQGLFRMWNTFKDNKEIYTDKGYQLLRFGDDIKRTFNLYHCFGDPSARLYAKKPIELTSVSHSTSKNGEFYIVQVNTGLSAEDIERDNITISVYEKNIDRLTVISQPIASLNLSTIDDIEICISGNNIVPYIFKPTKPFIWGGLKKNAIERKARSFIREDRIWEYASYLDFREIGDHDNHDIDILRTKFDGTTEINGKTYHNFIATYLYSYSFRAPNHLPPYFLYESHDIVPLAYIREEGNSYYMLLPERKPEHEEFWKRVRDIYGSTKNEYKIYNFDIPDGESFSILEDLDEAAKAEELQHLWSPDKIVYNPEPILEGEECGPWWEFNMLDTSEADPIETGFDAAYCNKSMTVKKMSRLYQQETVVEEIGCLNSLLPFPAASNYWAYYWEEYYDKCFPYYPAFRLQFVYDLEGNKVFTGNDLKIEMPDSSSIDSVNDDSIIVIYQNGELQTYVYGEDTARIKVYSATGCLEMATTVGSGHNTVSLADLPSGIYIVRFENADGMKTFKIRIE